MSTPDHPEHPDRTEPGDGGQPPSPGSDDGASGTTAPQTRDAPGGTPRTDVGPDDVSEGGAHAAPRPVPPTGHEAPRTADGAGSGAVVEEDLRTGAPTRTYPTAGDDRTRDPAGTPGSASGASAPVGTGTTAAGTTAGSTAGTASGAVSGAAAAGAARPDAHGTVTPHDRPGAAAERDVEERRRERARAESLEPPSKPGFVRHLLGVVVGLVLTPFAFLLTGIGGARLADIAGTSRMGTDTLGVVLLALGVLLLATLVLLGAWTATVPITGGVVWGLALGIAYLVAPDDLEATVENASGGTVPAAMDQFAQSAMSGLLLLVGVLLLASGVATALARRAGRRYGAAAVEYEHVRRGHPDVGR